MSTSYHLCMKITTAIELLKKGKNFFDDTPERVLRILTEARAEGKEFYSGCDNMNEKGMCAGHEKK